MGIIFKKLLAVLDRRIGKRTVKKLADNISNEPEWFQKFILLRAESEEIHCRTELDSKIMQNDWMEASAKEEAMILEQKQKAELCILDDGIAKTSDII